MKLRVVPPVTINEESHVNEESEPAFSSPFSQRKKPNRIRRLTQSRATQLVDEILEADDDAQAAALIELLTGIAYEEEFIDRDGLAVVSAGRAFSLTHCFSNSLETFASKACRRRGKKKE